MKFFFPDSQDLVDPSFDFEKECRSEVRIRHQDDQYAHEVFSKPPYDGILVSKAIVDGTTGGAGRYTLAQRHRFYRVGIREFFRLGDSSLKTMGDCGAFSYFREPIPPVSTEEVFTFYDECGFDYGVSVDHIIGAFRPDYDKSPPKADKVFDDWRKRQELTLQLAREFWHLSQKRHPRFKPIGVVQGWSPKSYARGANALQKMGYRTIAVGGLVPLKTPEILAVLEAISALRKPHTKLHLFGVTRCDHFDAFARYGVASFDSTSPLRQAFKDDRDNYHTLKRTYPAIRVPQVEGNQTLRRRIVAGEINQKEARRLELACMDSLIRYDKGTGSLPKSLSLLLEYESLVNGAKDYADEYREVLEERPWSKCHCDICKKVGIHVMLFRGAERNRRRGFHNVHVLYRKLAREMARA